MKQQRSLSTGARFHGRNLLVAMSAAGLLAACGEGAVEEAVSQAAPPTSAASAPIPDNSAPVIDGEPVAEIDAATTYVFQPSALDADGDALTFYADGLPAWATLDPATGRITGTPGADDTGESADIFLSVSDGKQISGLKSFRISIRGGKAAPAPSPAGNAAPTITGTPQATATAGTAWSFTPAANDPDSLNLTFSVAKKPSWASFSTTTGKLSGTPSASQVGTYSGIVITVSDGSRQASLPAFSVQVKAAANKAPTISGTPSGTATVGSAYSFTPTAADPEKQPLGFSIANKPSWASFSTATGALSGTPGAGNIGTFSNIVITVSDGAAQTALAPFSIAVQAAANGAPKIGGSPATTGRTGVAFSFTPTASDPDNDKLTFSITGKPAWASFSTTTGQLAGTPSAGAEGTYGNIVISVSDGKSTVSLPSFSILVSGSTVGSATLSWTPPTQNSDGSSLNNLAGYRIYYGTSESALTQSIQITNPGLTSYTIGNLAPARYYFGMASYTSDGVESAMSAVGSKTIN